MSLHRRLAIATGASLLALSVAGCSGLGRSAVGVLSYETGHEVAVAVTSPSVKGCHKLAPAGATKVENGTLVDVVLYRTRDCRGEEPTYLPSKTSNQIAPEALPWRSYTVVH
ncbi:hypothetical protein [Streptomyces sp. NPDC090025]|uniref:hypothetical protein n=1 Tax=Streptomyces sp. NPDC090025 TaxID=3365922 RepID=UPI0038389958